MSVFETVQVSCPGCEESNAFEAAYSVNGDRKPEGIEAIRNGSFQQHTCEHCGAVFRPEPFFTYLHIAKGQWICAFPAEDVADWPHFEATARASFDTSFGAEGPAMARSIGKDLRPRITFGWPALREKLEIAQAGLEDGAVEACKAALIAAVDDVSLAPGQALRFVGLDGDELVFSFVQDDDRPLSTVRLGRKGYDDVVASPEDWRTLTDAFQDALFVDLDRLFYPAEEASAAG